MAQLVSPGVEVTVVDESAYGSPGTGTIPLIVVATRNNKSDPTGSEPDGIAKWTKPINAGRPVRVTSQRELTQFFGDPVFDSTTTGVVIQGSETSEYGLLAAYSYLGQGSNAFILRADVDLAQLDSVTDEPVADWSAANTLWIDTDASKYGIHEYNDTTGLWVYQTPSIEINEDATSAEATGTFTPTLNASTVVDGSYLVVIHLDQDGNTSLQYFREDSDAWVALTSSNTTFAPHYSTPTPVGATLGIISTVNNIGAADISRSAGTYNVTSGSASFQIVVDGLGAATVTVTDGGSGFTVGDTITIPDADLGAGGAAALTFDVATVTTIANPVDVWIKTTSPANGIDLVVNEYTSAWISHEVQGVTSSVTGGLSSAIGDFIPQDGSSVTALTSTTAEEGNILLDLDTFGIILQRIDGDGAPEVLDAFAKYAQNDVPTATANTGDVWFNDELDGLDVYVVNGANFDAVTPTYAKTAPSGPSDGDVWINTNLSDSGQVNDRSYPKIYVYNNALSQWILHNNTDQSTERGVLFANISDTAADASTLITDAPDPLVYPDGMIAINMAQSKNTVRVWNGTAWRNGVANHADGSGRFGRYAQHAFVATAMQQALTNEDLREEQYNFTLLTAPFYPEATDELQTLNTDRGETGFIIIDTPMRLNPTQAVNWVQNSNVAAENGEDGLVSNYTYSAVYYPSGASTEPVNGNTVVVPPSHMALYTYAYSDNVSYVWFPPAGLARGVVQNASAVGYLTTENEFKPLALSQGQRDAMYTNKLNPITTFIGDGTVIFGQKSLHPLDTALDRVNVCRLVAYLRERFDDIARPFLFELNDEQTRRRAKLVFERFLADILTRRGIYDYAVVCDESNNTPARIDRNELWIDVAIEPAKAVEFIYIPIRIVNTGTL